MDAEPNEQLVIWFSATQFLYNSF